MNSKTLNALTERQIHFLNVDWNIENLSKVNRIVWHAVEIAESNSI